jgi:hypothetical protein
MSERNSFQKRLNPTSFAFGVDAIRRASETFCGRAKKASSLNSTSIPDHMEGVFRVPHPSNDSVFDCNRARSIMSVLLAERIDVGIVKDSISLHVFLRLEVVLMLGATC